MYSLNNYINACKTEINSMKSGTHKKQSLDIKLLGISRKQ